MSTLLTGNMPLLTDAPNGIKKLRELILELAVRGKLVQQDSSDEAANELLRRISESRSRLVAIGKLKKLKPQPEIAEEEKPFRLPDGWEWRRFGDFAMDVSTGPFGSLIHQSDYVDGGVPLVNPSHMVDGRIAPDQSVSLSKEMAESLNSYRLNEGDIVMARRGEVGRVALVTNVEDGWLCGTGSFVLRFSPEVSRPYIWTLFRCNSIRAYLAGKAVGTTMVNLNHGILLKMPIAIPPLAEQHRIVTKVDELMALCDRLEAQQAGAESAHARLVQALLDSLTQASDAADFAANWKRLTEHFHNLFTTESSIDDLKKTLLQLAVMGKLTPQLATDESVSEQLKLIGIEKQKLTAEGKSRTQKPLLEITENEKPYQIPKSWQWGRLGSHVIESNAGWSPSCELRKRVGDEWGVLKVSAVSWGSYRPEENKALPADLEPRPVHEVIEGDFLVSRANTAELVARSVVVEKSPIRLMLSDKIVRLKLTSFCNRRYINIVNSSIYARDYYGRIAGGTSSSMKNVSREQILNLLVPIPPLAEQIRIVAVVDKLWDICDQLKIRIIRSRQFAEQLSTVLVERALIVDTKIGNKILDQETARTLLAAEIVHKLHCEKRMGRVKLQKVISLAEHVARLKEIKSKEERYAAGPHDPALMTEAVQGLQNNQWFEELKLDDGKRYEYRPLAQAGAHLPAYEALWSAEQRQQINELIELMRSWDSAQCERVATLYSAWNDLLIEDREANEAAILQEVLHGWNESKLKYSEAQWRAELAEMHQHSFLIPTGFGKRTSGGKLTLPGFEPSI